MPQPKATDPDEVATLKHPEHAHFVAPIEECPEVVAKCRAAELAGISSWFPGIAITVSENWETWYADHDGCHHEKPGMGALAVDLWHSHGGLG